MLREMQDVPSNVSFKSMEELGLRTDQVYDLVLRSVEDKSDGRIAAALLERAPRTEAQLAVRTHRPGRKGWKPAQVLIGAMVTTEVPELPGTWLTSAPIVLQGMGKWSIQEALLRRSRSRNVIKCRSETRSVAAIGPAWSQTLTRGALMLHGYLSSSFDEDERDVLEAAIGHEQALLLRTAKRQKTRGSLAALGDAAGEPLATERRALSATLGVTTPAGIGASLELKREYEIVRVKVR
jgi:hypothetical protein